MSSKICVAQSVEELKFILKNTKKEEVVCVPLNLPTQLFCIKNKLNFYDPINFINNNFYKEALLESENLINKLDVSELKFESHIKEYKAFMRFKFYSAVFLIELIEKINTYRKINEIFVSGWNRYIDQYSRKNYFISYLIYNLITNIKISRLSKYEEDQISSKEEKNYVIRNRKLNKKKNYVLMNNTGYNFKRIIFFLQKKNCYIIVPTFNKISFFKKILFRILKIIFLEFNVHSSKKRKNIPLTNIEFFYKKKNISKILNFRKEQEIGNLIKLQNQSSAIDYLFDQLNIKLVLSNATRGINGYYLEKSKIKNIPSVCITHGTLAPAFNQFDKIYKNIIAEAATINKSEYFAVQSKITKKFVESNSLNANTIETGNLIFSESKNRSKKKILFAVTLKDFENFQFLGVEMYYEFLDNLSLFNKLSKKHNLDFLVKPHPSENRCVDDLKKIFMNLEFTQKKISEVLKNVFATISFSSTVIEDSLHSNIPVILFDRWKRYKHCNSEENINKKNSAAYYVNNEKDLINCLSTVKSSENINFNEYIFSGNSKKNIDNLISKFL